MSRKYKFHNPQGVYFVSFSVVYWMDVFIRNEYKNILIQSWQKCIQERGLEVYAWVIMTSHVHMIFSSLQKKPENMLGNIKSYTALKVRKAIQENPQESRKEWMLWMMQRAASKNGNNGGYQFWQQHNQPIELFSSLVSQQKLDYIHDNPVVAGFVDAPEHYLYSSARDYVGGKGLLEGIRLM